MSQPQAEFVEIFRDETRERLDRVVETLLAIEAGRPPDDAVGSLFRELHTIKGAAGMVGFDEIEALAHALEDVLTRARVEGALDAPLVALALPAVDALRRHLDGAGEPVAPLIERLAATSAASQPAAAAEQAEPRTASEPGGRRAIRVAPEKIDELLDLVGETMLHRRRLEHVVASGAVDTQRVSDELDAGRRLLDGLKDAAIGMRTLPVSSITPALARAVRDLGLEAGKEVSLAIDGADTELDRTILERLSDLLVHLIRNAVAHGIEPPGERLRLGKPRVGRLRLGAEQRGGTVVITVSDDGGGVSPETLAEARHAGSLVAVLARPGYSTADFVSAVAGRGVGLDAVKSQVESFGGSLELRSEPGVGTDVVLRLPLALALLDVLLMERAGRIYGIPLASVEEVVSLEAILQLAGRASVNVRGEAVPLADLAELVGGQPPATRPGAPAVIVRASERRAAAVCDAVLGNDEVVVKPLGTLLGRLDAYLGAAILGDGQIALLLDPAALVKRMPGRRALDRARPATDEPPPAARVPLVLVVEDSLAVRELQRSILEAAGYRVQTARDGQEAIERLERDEPVDLVLTDVDMPNVDGIALTRAIRAHPRHSALPVVVVTAREQEDDRQRGMDAGADSYVTKRGFDQHALLETLERLIGR